MLEIHSHNLHWLETVPPEHDICAHGGVVIRFEGQVIADRRESSWTLSAAALYLLRALERDHTPQAQVGDHLFPCCGHAMFQGSSPSEVVIVGCPGGFDFEVRHSGSQVRLLSPGEFDVSVASEEWRRAVNEFSDQIRSFYTSSTNKAPQVDIDGYAAFCAEWELRRERSRRKP